jgi:hypothetical protein
MLFMGDKMREPFKPIQVGLEYEDTIIWITKVAGVIDKKVVASSRNRKPKYRTKIVGYTVLMPESPNNGHAGCFNRRVFIEDANGVPPGKVFPGVPLEKCREPSDIVPVILMPEQLISRMTAEKGLTELHKINNQVDKSQ